MNVSSHLALFPAMIPADRLIRYLFPASFLYLGLPILIFNITWLKPLWAWSFAALTVALLASTIYPGMRRQPEPDGKIDVQPGLQPLHGVLFFLVCTIWLVVSGVGGIGYQDPDWVKHNAILKDLIDYPWPVIYDFQATPVPLAYYIAYYLPAAAVGKIGGWTLANAALFVWTLVGLVLAVLWFLILQPRISALTVLVFVFFSGMDIVGRIISLWAGWYDFPPWSRTQFELWASALQYSSHTTLLFWVPHQALAGWISGGIMFYLILYDRPRKFMLLPLGLSTLWSPFVVIGLLPIFAASLFAGEAPFRVRFKQHLSWINTGALLLALLAGLFYASKLADMSPLAKIQVPHGFFLTSYHPETPSLFGGSIWDGVALIVTFCVLEFGIYALFLSGPMLSEPQSLRRLFVAMLLTLSLLPFYTLGIANDLVMRASIPVLFLLSICIGRALNTHTVSKAVRAALVASLLVGAATPAMEGLRHLVHMVRGDTAWQTPGNSDVPGVLQVYKASSHHLIQYVGSAKAPFFRYLAKERSDRQVLRGQ
jgi:hypothetical protein